MGRLSLWSSSRLVRRVNAAGAPAKRGMRHVVHVIENVIADMIKGLHSPIFAY